MSLNLHAEDNKIEELYRLNNISGSILIESLDGNSKYQYNVNESERFIPASTFKIPNTLIVLEEGLIKDHASWNKDQTLKSAFQYSCVWCYQRYAKQVGNQKYRAYLRKLHYGNTLTGNDISRFWLDGELKISVLKNCQYKISTLKRSKTSCCQRRIKTTQFGQKQAGQEKMVGM